MVTCSYCQTENPDDAQLCRECARPLPRDFAAGVAPADPAAPSSAITCSYCQTDNPGDARFCRQCGREVARSVSADVAVGDPSDAGTATTCRACGQTASAEAQFCPNCGTDFVSAEYGSFWRRFGGFVVDWVILAVAGGIIGAFFGLAAASSGVSLLIGAAYYIPLNANGGTLGKKALGLRVEDAKTGEDIGLGRSAIRYVVAIASALALLLGYFWCIWDPKKQTWHDKAAGSVVVRM